MTDFLDEKRREIQARLKELRPLVEEFQRLEAAEAAPGERQRRQPCDRPPPRRQQRKAHRRPGGARGAAAAPGARHAPKQALELVRSRPGITVPELAEAMGIKQNYLYRVMPSAAEDGSYEAGRGWHPREAA